MKAIDYGKYELTWKHGRDSTDEGYSALYLNEKCLGSVMDKAEGLSVLADSHDFLLSALRERDEKITEMRGKLAQIHICAENAQYGLLDPMATINSITIAAELEGE